MRNRQDLPPTAFDSLEKLDIVCQEDLMMLFGPTVCAIKELFLLHAHGGNPLVLYKSMFVDTDNIN